MKHFETKHFASEKRVVPEQGQSGRTGRGSMWGGGRGWKRRAALLAVGVVGVLWLGAERARMDSLQSNIPAGTDPIGSSVNPVTNKIYVANRLSNTVTVIDGADNSTQTVATGPGPGDVAVNPVTNKIYVADGDGVTVINGADNSTQTVRIGAYPGALAINPVTNKIYVTHNGIDMTIINGADNSTATVETGAEPYAIAVNLVTNKIYVANSGSNDVTVINGADNTHVTLPVGAKPFAIAVNPVTNKIYVANGDSNNVTIINGANNTLVTVPVGKYPEALAINPVTNKIYVANANSADVTVINGADNSTATIAAGQSPQNIAVNPMTNKIYVVNDLITTSSAQVTVINGADNSTRTVAVGALPDIVTINPVTNKIYAVNRGSNNVTVIDGADNSTMPITTGANPNAIGVNPVTNKIYVANFGSNDVTVINGDDNSTATVPAGRLPNAIAVNPVTNKIYVANNNNANVTVINGADNSTQTVASGSDPNAIAVNPVTNKIYVANIGSNDVTVINGADNSTQTVAAGMTPRAVAVNPVTNQIYVANQDSNNVTVISGDDNSTQTVGVGTFPYAIAVNPVTNKIYVVNNHSANMTVIDGADHSTATVPTGVSPIAVAVNPVTNKIYVATPGVGGSVFVSPVTIINGADNSTETVMAGRSPQDIAVNPVTNQIYVANYFSNNVTAITEQNVQPIPLTVAITFHPGPTPRLFDFTVSDTFAPIAPLVRQVYYQLDTWQGPWLKAAPAGNFTQSAQMPLELAGPHILYAFATEGEDGTPTNTGSVFGASCSPLIGPISALVFSTASVTLGNLAQTYDGTPKSATATTNPPGLGVTLTYNGSSTAPTNAGSYMVVATVNNAIYQGSASGTLVINKASQTISFGPLANRTFGDPPFALNATASSGLPVSFSVLSGPATVSGNMITLTGAGMVTVRASQAGDGNFNPAASVDQSLTVAQAATSTALSSSANPAAFGQSITLTATVSSLPAGTVTPTGMVTFTIDGKAQPPISLSNGMAQFTTATLASGSHGVSANYSGDTNFAASSGALAGGQVVSPQPITLQLEASAYTVAENGGQLLINVLRTGDLTTPVTVDFATSDLTATDHSDYNTARGTLSFAAGTASQTITILINQDNYQEGTETFSLTLSHPTGGATLAAPSSAIISIMDDDTAPPTSNVIDEAGAFVRQLYHDFLNREPDAGGLIYWTNEITKCGTDQSCVRTRRIDVAAAFFIEQEFQRTGFYIDRVYEAGLGRRASYLEFTADRNRLLGGTSLTAATQAYTQEFVQRGEFTGKYPVTLTGAQFVDALLANVQLSTGVDLSGKRVELQTVYQQGTSVAGSRAVVLSTLVNYQAYRDAEVNRGFVLAQYYEFLRRDVDEAGYQFWLNVLNTQVGGNYRSMVCAFVTSKEYQRRFSSVVTHSNQECGP